MTLHFSAATVAAWLILSSHVPHLCLAAFWRFPGFTGGMARRGGSHSHTTRREMARVRMNNTRKSFNRIAVGNDRFGGVTAVRIPAVQASNIGPQ